MGATSDKQMRMEIAMLASIEERASEQGTKFDTALSRVRPPLCVACISQW